ncbi:hypothetical protein JTB14_000748 [Gonioctena quinquepunctata]|nr:hypothetical protein JTB14_000748 [Gonioctena quinquepunctata]
MLARGRFLWQVVVYIGILGISVYAGHDECLACLSATEVELESTGYVQEGSFGGEGSIEGGGSAQIDLSTSGSISESGESQQEESSSGDSATVGYSAEVEGSEGETSGSSSSSDSEITETGGPDGEQSSESSEDAGATDAYQSSSDSESLGVSVEGGGSEDTGGPNSEQSSGSSEDAGATDADQSSSDSESSGISIEGGGSEDIGGPDSEQSSGSSENAGASDTSQSSSDSGSSGIYFGGGGSVDTGRFDSDQSSGSSENVGALDTSQSSSDSGSLGLSIGGEGSVDTGGPDSDQSSPDTSDSSQSIGDTESAGTPVEVRNASNTGDTGSSDNDQSTVDSENDESSSGYQVSEISIDGGISGGSGYEASSGDGSDASENGDSGGSQSVGGSGGFSGRYGPILFGGSLSGGAKVDFSLALKNFVNVAGNLSLPQLLSWIYNYLESWGKAVNFNKDAFFDYIAVLKHTYLFSKIQNGAFTAYASISGTISGFVNGNAAVDKVLGLGNITLECIVAKSDNLPVVVGKRLVGCVTNKVEEVFQTLANIVVNMQKLLIVVRGITDGIADMCGVRSIAKAIGDVAEKVILMMLSIITTILGVAKLVALTPVQLPACMGTSLTLTPATEVAKFVFNVGRCVIEK